MRLSLVTRQHRQIKASVFSSKAGNTIDNVYVQKLSSAFVFPSLFVITTVALGLAFTGCGSSGSPTAATAAPITVAVPTISVPTGTYTTAQQVTIQDTTPGTTIYYTTDGNAPSTSSTPYAAPFSVSISSTVKAIAVLSGVQSTIASSTLTINLPLPPAMLAFTQQPSNVLTGSNISPPVQVAIEDSNGNLVSTATNAVTLALAGGSGLAGTLTVSAQNGVAAFPNLTIGAAGTGYTLVASSPGLGSATSTGFAATPVAPSPTKLAFSHQPSSALTGTPLSPAITVTVEDASGNPVTTASNPVALTLVSGTGLGGTLTATPSNGVATFSNVTEAAAGTYMLSASSDGLASATSTAFTVTAPINNGTTIIPDMPASITASPGSTFQVTYIWLAVPVSVPATVFVNFIDSSGAVQFQDNVQPSVSPSQWNGLVVYTHTVTVPAALAGGTYSIVSGLKSANGNISLIAGGGVSSLPDAQYQIGTLIVEPTCPIDSFGAVGDGTTDNGTSIQTAFNYAAAHQCIALIPAGTFAYSGNLMATGISIAGLGATSILKPLSLSKEAIILSGSGASISNLALTSAANTRLLSQQSGMIWISDADNYYVENVLIDNSSSTGILSQNSSGGFILNNTIENTLADSVTQVYGSNNITVYGNRILNSGDDGVSNNSYVGDPNPVHGVTIQGNTVLNNKGGRGLEVSGGTDISFVGNYVDNLDGYTDMYIASESEFNTQGASNIKVSGNSFIDGGPNQGSAIVYNSQAQATSISNVDISGNQFVNPKLSALEYAGNGAETAISVTNNIDYTTNQFSRSSNSSAVVTETGNQLLAPSSYSAPLVAPGGGCSFTGC